MIDKKLCVVNGFDLGMEANFKMLKHYLNLPRKEVIQPHLPTRERIQRSVLICVY